MKRRTPLKRTAMKRSTKQMPKVNPARARKRRQSYRQKLAAMKKGPGYKAAIARAGGRCEMVEHIGAWRDAGGIIMSGFDRRCPETEGLHAHHQTYARFGGKELPEDLVILCKRHHEIVESQHPTRRNGRIPRAA